MVFKRQKSNENKKIKFLAEFEPFKSAENNVINFSSHKKNSFKSINTYLGFLFSIIVFAFLGVAITVFFYE